MPRAASMAAIAASVSYRQEDASWNLARLSSAVPLDPTSGQYNYYHSMEGGYGMTAYLLDSGVDHRHPEFQGRVRWGAHLAASSTPCTNLFPPWIKSCVWDETALEWREPAKTDDAGHGTNVAGVIMSKTFGVAKKARLTSIKVCGATGYCSLSKILKGLEWVVKDARCKKTQQTSVVVLPVQGLSSYALRDAITSMVDMGFQFVTAGGNDGDPIMAQSPATLSNTLTACATNIYDNFASYSNYGAKCDILAPGTNITAPTSHPLGWHNMTSTKSGTSFAAAHVAGVSLIIKSIKAIGATITNQTTLYNQIVGNARMGQIGVMPADTYNRLLTNGYSYNE